MSIELPAFDTRNEVVDDSDSSDEIASEVDEDQTWDDWTEQDRLPCKSLFEDKVFEDVEKAVAHDKEKWGFDLGKTSKDLSLDFHQRTRLINFIRKTNPSPESLKIVKGDEQFFKDDAFLIPIIPDDPLLLQTPDSDWSESGSDPEPSSSVKPPPPAKNLKLANRKIAHLESQLSQSQSELVQLRSLIQQKLDLLENPKEKDEIAKKRDDDSHYFESYGNYEIHATMIQDTVRTSSYATFILSNPHLFENATVMDIGCGTGILSLLAAKAGAKKVWAIEASEEVAKKAETIVKENDYEDVITVVHGKVEDLSLPDVANTVDILISEWMGYALLYESMLPSVLHARDIYLKKSPSAGIMAPSQCRMFLTMVQVPDIMRERLDFWDDVYGFKMGVFKEDVLKDSIVEVVKDENVVTDASMVKDLHLHETTTRSLDFVSSFSLTASPPPFDQMPQNKKTHAHAFLLYFDTFFSPSGSPVPPETPSTIARIPIKDVMQPRRKSSTGLGQGKGKGREVSFTTGPGSMPTHWKQTLFLLRKPVELDNGTNVTGTFHCRRSEENSRELDVEVHYSVLHAHEAEVGKEAPPVVVQMFKVR